MPQLKKNLYAALAGKEDDEENDTKSTGVENDDKITGVHHDNKVIEADSNNESTGIKSESASMGEIDEADEMALVEEAIAEAEQDISEGTDNRTGATVNDILPDDKANETFNKIDGNITGVDWET